MFECSVVSQACSLSVLSHHTHPTNCPPPHTHTLPGHDKHHSPTAPDGDDEHHSSRGPWVCAREPRAGIPTQLVSYSHPHPLPPNVQSGDSDSDSGASDSDSTSSLADPCSGCEGTRCGGLRCDDLGTISSAASSSSMQAPRSHDGFQHTVKVAMSRVLGQVVNRPTEHGNISTCTNLNVPCVVVDYVAHFRLESIEVIWCG